MYDILSIRLYVLDVNCKRFSRILIE